jgi:hypothetical protein
VSTTGECFRCRRIRVAKLEVHRKSIACRIHLPCSRVTKILLRTIDRRRQSDAFSLNYVMEE